MLTSVLPVYDELLAAELKMLVYSGDVDAIVPGARAARCASPRLVVCVVDGPATPPTHTHKRTAVIGTRRWIHDLDAGPITDSWRAWRGDNGQARALLKGGWEVQHGRHPPPLLLLPLQPVKRPPPPLLCCCTRWAAGR